MKSFKLIIIVMPILFLACIVEPSYTPPVENPYNTEKYIKNVNMNFEDTWTALIDFSSSSFYAIDVVEKDSGLITLDFGSREPSEFIDCGNIQFLKSNYDGPFVEGIELKGKADLDGRMNIFVKPISENVTQVKVKARYIFKAQKKNRSQTWDFDTGQSDYKKFGKRDKVICQPTYEAENFVLSGIEKISEGVPTR